jgi:hypothetical protein
MVIGDIEAILADLRDTTSLLIQAGKREEVLNERFFHHMFSHRVSSIFEARREDIWGRLGIIPECPTDKGFRRIHIDTKFYVYVMTIPNAGPVPIRWGKIGE